MTSEHKDGEAIYPLPAYEYWLEDTKRFESKSLERKTQILQEGMKLFVDVVEKESKRRIVFPYLTHGKEIPEEFKDSLKDYRRIDITNASSVISETKTILIDLEGKPDEFDEPESKVDITVSSIDGKSYEAKIDYMRADFFSSPGGRTIQKPAIANLTNIQIVKFINWVAREAIKESKPNLHLV